MEIGINNVTYEPHSMMHTAVVDMQPTKLEFLDRYKKVDNGHIFTPKDSNVRAIISGRDWTQKRIFIYGAQSTDEARNYIQLIIDDLSKIDHKCNLLEEPYITNIAVGGDLGISIPLEQLSVAVDSEEVDIEYEPEQFPAAIVKLGAPESTFMLYSTGKFIIQGLTKLSDIDLAVEKMVNILNSGDYSK